MRRCGGRTTCPTSAPGRRPRPDLHPWPSSLPDLLRQLVPTLVRAQSRPHPPRQRLRSVVELLKERRDPRSGRLLERRFTGTPALLEGPQVVGDRAPPRPIGRAYGHDPVGGDAVSGAVSERVIGEEGQQILAVARRHL